LVTVNRLLLLLIAWTALMPAGIATGESVKRKIRTPDRLDDMFDSFSPRSGLEWFGITCGADSRMSGCGAGFLTEASHGGPHALVAIGRNPEVFLWSGDNR
jgi:hypothetical protein